MAARRIARAAAGAALLGALALVAPGCGLVGIPIVGAGAIEVVNHEASFFDVRHVLIVPAEEYAWELDGDEDVWDEDADATSWALELFFTLVFQWGAPHGTDESTRIEPGESESFRLVSGTYDVVVRWSDGLETVERDVYVLGGFTTSLDVVHDLLVFP